MRVSVRRDLIDNVFALLKQGTFANVPFGRILDLMVAIENDAKPIPVAPPVRLHEDENEAPPETDEPVANAE